MTIGVSGFVGKRLTEARLARGWLTQKALAEYLQSFTNVTNATIHGYENGTVNPRAEKVSELADALKVKESYFFTPLPSDSYPIFWRSTHTTTRDKRAIAQAKFSWTKLIDSYLKQYLDMPALNLPEREAFGIPDDIEHLTDRQIEDIALRLRDYWGLGTTPIQNMTMLLENNGILLSYGELDSLKLDAFSNKSEYDNSYHIFLGTDKGEALRSRMDAAHELGHVVLHSHLSEKEFLGKKHRLFEHQAFRFGSAFLMPAEAFKNDVWMTSMEALKSLRKRWLVSVGAMMHRCEDLGMYGDRDTSRMWAIYRRNWREIDDGVFEFERPQLQTRSVELLIAEGLRSKAQILYDLPFYQSDIERILNLPAGYFNQNMAELKEFPTLKIREDRRQHDLGEITGDVVHYHDFDKRGN